MRMRELVAIVIGVVAACGGGGKQTVSSTPASSPGVDCASTAAVITRVLSAGTDAKDVKVTATANDEITKRCTADKWTSEARSCLAAATTGEALKDCGYNHLTQAQADKLKTATAALTSVDLERVIGEMAKFKDQLCACRDAACAQKVSDDIMERSQELAKDQKEPPELTEDQQRRLSALGEEMGTCMQVAMGMGGAGGGPVAPLAVTGLDPETGDPAGGTYVAIKGTSFVADGGRDVKVYFGDKQATVVRFSSDTELIVEAPGGKANQTVDVRLVFDPGGEMKITKGFTYGKKKKPAKKK
jgi:hypothetical protein